MPYTQSFKLQSNIICYLRDTLDESHFDLLHSITYTSTGVVGLDTYIFDIAMDYRVIDISPSFTILSKLNCMRLTIYNPCSMQSVD